MRVAHACLENISPYQFWSIADLYLYLVRHLHAQIRLVGYFGLNGGALGLPILMVNFVFFAKKVRKMSAILILDCLNFRDNHESLLVKPRPKVIACNPSDGTQISQFFSSLDREQKILFPLGSSSPF